MTPDEKRSIEIALKTLCDSANYPLYVSSVIGNKKLKKFVADLAVHIWDKVNVEFQETNFNENIELTTNEPI